MARKLQEDWETEEERKRLAEEEATKTALLDEYDFIQARIKADRLLTTTQQMSSGSQTVLGKDYSNLLIANSLLKTIWFINAPCYNNEALASPKANGV
ncbi:hypothetical protein Tco_0936092, partial [Tanacetum coccineum]